MHIGDVLHRNASDVALSCGNSRIVRSHHTKGDLVMKKKKIVLWAVGAVLAVIVVAVAVTWVMIDSIAKRAVQEGGQYALGVPTTVDTMNLSLVGGSLRMGTLNIANPTGYNSPHLMRAGTFHLAVNPGSVFSDTVVVPTFELDGLDVNIESKGMANNIGVVLDHVKKLGGDSGKAGQQASQPPSQGSGKKLMVNRVVIRNVAAHVTLPLPGSKPLTVSVPTIELNNVSSDKGVTVQELISRLMPAILASILEAGKDIIPGDLLAGLNTQLADTVNALGGQASQLVQQGIGQAGAQVQQALKQVEKVVPGEAGKVAGEVTKQAQGALGQAQKTAAGQLHGLTGAVAATQPAGLRLPGQK
jgi:hypothetical protein